MPCSRCVGIVGGSKAIIHIGYVFVDLYDDFCIHKNRA